MINKKIEINTEKPNQNIKIRVFKNKDKQFIEIIVYDFETKKTKFTYSLIENKNFNKFINFFKGKEKLK